MSTNREQSCQINTDAKLYAFDSGTSFDLAYGQSITPYPNTSLTLDKRCDAGLFEILNECNLDVFSGTRRVLDIAHIDFSEMFLIEGNRFVLLRPRDIFLLRHPQEHNLSEQFFTELILQKLEKTNCQPAPDLSEVICEAPSKKSKYSKLFQRNRKMHIFTLTGLVIITITLISTLFFKSPSAQSTKELTVNPEPLALVKQSSSATTDTKVVNEFIGPLWAESLQKQNVFKAPLVKSKKRPSKRLVRENPSNRRLLNGYLLEENFDSDSALIKMIELRTQIRKKTKLRKDINRHIRRLKNK